MGANKNKPAGEVILYQTKDAQTRLEVRLDGQTAWLSLNQLAELFQRDKSVISKHLKNIFEEGEMQPSSVVANFATTATDGKIYQVAYYNLDAIIAVGYRVKSQQGTAFRIWATQNLRDYLVRGFALNEERLKQEPGYFEQLLGKIRDIRSSEKVFWRKVLEIYATSVDYDARAEASQQFFATVQNKMHWAAHGHTAAEIIHARVDAGQPFMGLKTTRPGGVVRKEDVATAKNYLSADELEALNRLVMAYLEFAELQAMNRKPMTMAAWIAKLDDFLRLGDREILTHAGKISHEAAAAKAMSEFSKYRVIEDTKPSAVEKDFEGAVNKLKQLKQGKKKP
jgi:hypothetical protein